MVYCGYVNEWKLRLKLVRVTTGNSRVPIMENQVKKYE